MPSWKSHSDDPNSPEAHRYRQECLQRAWREPITDRIAALEDRCRGRRVLDLGVVNHTVAYEAQGNWLHDRLRRVAANCLGLDILAGAVEELRAKGYNVRVFDITSGQDLGERFEVIVAGELIEHLGAPEKLFQFARQHLEPNGTLILTTPNPYYIRRQLSFARRQSGESVDHVTFLFPSGVAELAERAGMQLVEYRGVKVPLRTWRGRWLERWITRRRWDPDLLCDTHIYCCQVAP